MAEARLDRRKKEFKDESLRVSIMKSLRSGKLNTAQLSARLGHKSSAISSVCNKYPEIFEFVGVEYNGRARVYVWKLKDGSE